MELTRLEYRIFEKYLFKNRISWCLDLLIYSQLLKWNQISNFRLFLGKI